MTSAATAPILQTSHLLGIEGLSVPEINGLLVYRAEMRGRGIGTALIR